jgi:hypothetical protein
MRDYLVTGNIPIDATGTLNRQGPFTIFAENPRDAKDQVLEKLTDEGWIVEPGFDPQEELEAELA